MKHRQAPNRWTLRSLQAHCAAGIRQQAPDGSWMPARCLGMDSLTSRLALAWSVFIGRADALFWSDKP